MDGDIAAEPGPDAVPTLVRQQAGSRTLPEPLPTVPAAARLDATDGSPGAAAPGAGAEPSTSFGPKQPSSRSTALIGAAAVAVLGVVAGLVSLAHGFSDSAPEVGPTATLRSPDLSVNDLAFSPDGDTLSVGTWEGNVRLWDVAEGKRRATLTHRDEAGVGPNEVHSLDFSPDGRTLATGTQDGDAYLWDVAGRRKAATLHGDDGPVKSVDFAPGGRKLATGSLKGTAYLKYTGGRSKGRVSAGFDHGTAVGPAAVSPNGKVLVTATLQGYTPQVAKLWDTAGGKARYTLPHKGGLSSAAFSPDSEKLAVGGVDAR